MLCIAGGLLAHPYEGIYHDANLYVLQALARLHPDSLAGDVFLRFGSQDRFTLFSPGYAAAIQLLGLDHAAALLTLLSVSGLLGAAWTLARTAMPSAHALLGTAILLVVPGNYGPDRIFACIEPFLTPRMAAEACTAAAVAAALAGRRRWSCAWMVLALVLHPVIAAAGLALLFMAYVALPRPGTAALLTLLIAAALAAAAWALPAGEWGRLDPAWLALVSQRSPYLFLSFWQLEDWGRSSVVLTTLVLGAFILESNARRLCASAALTLVAGIALTWLACDLLHLTRVTQLQPWRWEWLAALVAALTLPLVSLLSWRRGMAGRATVLLLLAAWIFGSGVYALIAALTALLSLGLARLQPRELRLAFGGACAVLALALLWRVASNFEFLDVHYMDSALPLWLRRTISFLHDGLAPGALLCAMIWLLRTYRTPLAAAFCAALGAAALAAVAPFAWSAWDRQEFPQQDVARYAGWRDLIPPGAEVFWAESPLSTWVLLQRRSYISGLQTSGMVFSRAAALELERRAQGLGGVMGPATFLSWSGAAAHLSLQREALQGICRLGVFGYLVTSTDLGTPPLAEIDRLKLYACAPQARAAAAAT